MVQLPGSLLSGIFSFPYYSHTTPIKIPKDMGIGKYGKLTIRGPTIGSPWNHPWLTYIVTRWWLNQPSWKICSSNWIISPGSSENKKPLKPPSRYIMAYEIIPFYNWVGFNPLTQPSPGLFWPSFLHISCTSCFHERLAVKVLEATRFHFGVYQTINITTWSLIDIPFTLVVGYQMDDGSQIFINEKWNLL